MRTLVETYEQLSGQIEAAQTRKSQLWSKRQDQVIAAAVKAIESTGLSRRKFAAVMGISPPYLCDLLKGNRAWDNELAVKFDNAVGTITKLKL
jgi:transcriptional regulator with XRE-family HTH domain